MDKKSKDTTSAWIGVFGGIVVAILTGLFTLIKSSDTSQSSGGINNSSFSTYGDNSPVVSGDMNIENQTVQQVCQEEKFVYMMQTQTVVKTEVVYLRNDDLGLTLNELTKISELKRRTGVDILIPTNGIARIKAPQKMYDLSAKLAKVYNATETEQSKINECFALASEGTNIYESLRSAYNSDSLCMVDGDYLVMAAAYYQTLAEYWMFKKDYEKGLQLISRSQELYPGTNVLAFATQAALCQLAGQDEQCSSILSVVKSFPEPIRYEIINTLTRMGYLRPSIAKKTQDGQWVISNENKLEQTFGLSKNLQFPLLLRLVVGGRNMNPTLIRWVGLNQYEPVDLVLLNQQVLDKLQKRDQEQNVAP